MSGWNVLEAIYQKMKPVHLAFGSLRPRFVTICEDCINYPIADVVALVRQYRQIFSHTYDTRTQSEIDTLSKMLDATQPIEHPIPRHYLWAEDNPPTETVYTDNSEERYNHDPDFRPYFYEILLPDDVTPKGAVVVCAGGDHGDAAVPEGYQVALDFHAMGYQCFLLQNRTNHNPWSPREAGVDGARAIRMIRQHADRYHIAPDNIAFAGFSNGGVTGEGLIQYFSGTQTVRETFPNYHPDALDTIDATPNAFLCVYGPRFAGEPFDYERVIYPPTFFAVGREDGAMENLNAVYPDLLAHNIPVEVHTFAGVPHGKAGDKLIAGEVLYPNFELWEPLADAFLQNIFQKK